MLQSAAAHLPPAALLLASEAFGGGAVHAHADWGLEQAARPGGGCSMQPRVGQVRW
jgi:hypothetical protein